MVLTTTNLTPRVGAEIQADKNTLLRGGEVSAELRRILEQRGVLIARGVDFEDSELVTFMKTLGTVRLGAIKSEGVDGVLKVTFDKKENPAYADYFRGTFYWHMDGPFEEIPPLATVLSPRILSPSGGETEFANTYAAYDDLPDQEKKYLSGLKVVHSVEAHHRVYEKNPSPELLAWWHSFPARERPMVWTHRSGRKSLFLSVSADHVVGMERSESDALLRRLIDWATQPQYVYRHHWKMGDILIWDNTGTMHRVLPFDMECGRRLHRVTLEGEETVDAAA